MLRIVFGFIEIKIKIQVDFVIENNKVGIIRTYRNGYNVTMLHWYSFPYMMYFWLSFNFPD